MLSADFEAIALDSFLNSSLSKSSEFESVSSCNGEELDLSKQMLLKTPNTSPTEYQIEPSHSLTLSLFMHILLLLEAHHDLNLLEESNMLLQDIGFISINDRTFPDLQQVSTDNLNGSRKAQRTKSASSGFIILVFQ